MKTRVNKHGSVSVVAQCENCGFEAQLVSTAVRESKKHVALTGHKVSIETVQYATITPILNAKNL